jgi:hypothetical protein
MNADVGHSGLTPTDERLAHVGNLPWRADSRSLIDAFANHGVRYAEVSVRCLIDMMHGLTVYCTMMLLIDCVFLCQVAHLSYP